MSDHHDKIGAALRDARQACGLSLDEVAERIHIRPVYLQAIEAGQFELLPAVPQRLGFTRCYADFLQVDLGDDLCKLSEEVNNHVSQADYSAPELLLPASRPRLGIFGVAAVLMALVAGGVFYYSGTRSGDVAETNAPQTGVPPAKASLPVLDEESKTPAPRLAKPLPAGEQSKAPAETGLAQENDDTAPVDLPVDAPVNAPADTPAEVAKQVAKVTPVIATEAHAAPGNELPKKDAAPDATKTEAAKAEAQKTDATPVAAQNEAAQNPAATDSGATKPKTAYLASGDVYIRAQPDNGGQVLGVVNRCEPLQVIGGTRYWRHVERQDGTEGWIFTDYVAPRGDAGCV